MKIRGIAHVYPRPHINTDEIIPARYLTTQDPAILAKHAMEDLDTDFVKRVQPGDIVVASEDFGCGSSREHAVWALVGAGVKVVIASSFARIFFRNAINNGFLVLESPEAHKEIATGDEIEVDLEQGKIFNLNKNKELSFGPLTDFARQMIEAGGLLPLVKRRVVAGSSS